MAETTCTSGSLCVEKRHDESRWRVGLGANDATGAISKTGKHKEMRFIIDGGWDTEVKNLVYCVLMLPMVQI